MMWALRGGVLSRKVGISLAMLLCPFGLTEMRLLAILMVVLVRFTARTFRMLLGMLVWSVESFTCMLLNMQLRLTEALGCMLPSQIKSIGHILLWLAHTFLCILLEMMLLVKVLGCMLLVKALGCMVEWPIKAFECTLLGILMAG